MSGYLKYIGGKDAGIEFSLVEGKSYVLGRGANATVQLQDGSISREHRKIRCEPNKAYIEHLSRTNPTLVNRAPVTNAELHDQDFISIGFTTLQYVEGTPAEEKTVPIVEDLRVQGPLWPPGNPLILKEGDKVKEYEVVSHIGRGNITVVYRVRDGKGINWSLKALRRIPEEGKGLGEKLLHGARVVSALKHPNLVGVRAAGKFAGHYFVVSEYIDGKNARQIMKEYGLIGALDNAVAIDIAIQVARGLVEAKNAGIAHLRIKPENVLVPSEGEAKLADLEIAGAIAAIASRFIMYSTGAPADIHFMAPEQLKDSATADWRSDIYSFGATIYCMITGRPPFDEMPLSRLVDAGSRPSLIPANEINLSMPDSFWQIIQHAMEPDPRRRYQEPADLVRDLEQLKNRLRIQKT